MSIKDSSGLCGKNIVFMSVLKHYFPEIIIEIDTVGQF